MVALCSIARINSSGSVVTQHTLPDHTFNVGGLHPVLEVVCRYKYYREDGDHAGDQLCADTDCFVREDFIQAQGCCFWLN